MFDKLKLLTCDNSIDGETIDYFRYICTNKTYKNNFKYVTTTDTSQIYYNDYLIDSTNNPLIKTMLEEYITSLKTELAHSDQSILKYSSVLEFLEKQIIAIPAILDLIIKFNSRLEFSVEVKKNRFGSEWERKTLTFFGESIVDKTTSKCAKIISIKDIENRPAKRQHRLDVKTSSKLFQISFDNASFKSQVKKAFPNFF